MYHSACACNCTCKCRQLPQGEIYVLRGYWQPFDGVAAAQRCPFRSTCIGGRVPQDDVSYLPSETDGLCSEHSWGVFCGMCAVRMCMCMCARASANPRTCEHRYTLASIPRTCAARSLFLLPWMRIRTASGVLRAHTGRWTTRGGCARPVWPPWESCLPRRRSMWPYLSSGAPWCSSTSSTESRRAQGLQKATPRTAAR